MQKYLDKVVLSKTVLLNFCPKQANKWIGDHMAWLFWLFIAFLTWPNLACLNRPFSMFFHPLTLLFIFWNLKNWDKKEWGPIIFYLFIAHLTWPNLICFSRPFSLFFYHLTPLWGEGGGHDFFKERPIPKISATVIFCSFFHTGKR